METKTFSDKVIEILRDYCDNMHNGNVKAASRALGLDADKGILYKWLNGRNSPRLDIIGPVLDRIGVELSTPAQRRQNSSCLRETEEEYAARLAKEKDMLEEALAKVELLQRSMERMRGENAVWEQVARMLANKAQEESRGDAALARENEKKVAFMGPNSFQN